MGNDKFFKSGIRLLFLVLMIFNSNSVNAQIINEEENSFWNQVQFGGGVGLNFGNQFFSGFLAPNAVYRHNKYVATGIGLNFSYSSQRDVFNSTVFGGSLIGLFNPIEEIQISTEFEQLFVSQNFDEQFVSNTDRTYSYSALFLGAGYRQGNVTFGIRYDVLYQEDRSIYAQAWIPFVQFWF